ncbi:Hypothetical_protein [Hexamita inflata]|uniref:Hypothetical_protein n=1 Tax=Hexamita inflata TaxID=28002 RepID=A0AA86UCW4_9EUKA|nr:Hypothetical protein HINF_LOCUS33767 [Hexamita inflata]
MTVICFKHNERQQKQLSQRSEDSRISIQSIHYEVKSGSKGSLGKLVLPSMWFRSRIVFANCHSNQTAEAKLKTTQRSRKHATSNVLNIQFVALPLLCAYQYLKTSSGDAMIIDTRVRLEVDTCQHPC